MKINSVRHIAVLAGVATTLAVTPAPADDVSGSKPVRADSHAPIGVMADHMHKKGEWMLSYRFMRMEMDGNQIGHQEVSPDTIVTTVPNAFAPPPTLRIVPLKMTMDMHMFGVMYAPSDRWTLMAMLNYVTKEMDHVTYQGMMGTTVLGNFTTKSDGLGDTLLSGLYSLRDTPNEKWHINLGVSLPTGDIEETGQVLTPMNTMPTLRLPYAMQLGSGTVDLKPGVTYNGRHDNFTWGAQYTATIRIGENDEGYTLGDANDLTAWAAFSPRAWWSFSGRLAYQQSDSIQGADPNIAGPVQTANPEFYGGSSLLGYLGLNLAGQHGWIRGQRLALEFGAPITQDLNGPQMQRDWSLTLGWQYAF